MALVTLARRSASKPTRLLHSLLLPSPLNPPPSLFPSLFSSIVLSARYCSSSAAPPSLLRNFSDIPIFDPSNYGLESNETIASAGIPELRGFLALLSQAKGRFSLKNELLRFLRASPYKPTEELVFWAIWELRDDCEKGILALRWGEECVVECPRAWHLMIWVLGREKRFDLAWGLVRRMHRRNILTSRALLILVERYAAANETSKAIRTFEAMEKFKIHSDSMAFYTLLRTLCKHGNVEEAEELLLSNRKLYPLGTEGFNIILNGWCNIVVDIVEAKRIWREMSNCCINPDGTSYSHMICCFSKVGNLFDTLRLYDEMTKRGWVSNIMVYNSLIYVLSREDCIKEAHNVFDKIKKVGLKADLNTYHAMIYPLCEAQKLPVAEDVLEDMINNGLDPTLETYHAFLKAMSMEGMLNLLKRMRDVGCGPNSDTFLLIFDNFFRMNQSGYALRLWREMRNYNIIPNNSHYMSLVQGLAAGGWISKAWEFYNEMKARGFSPDPKAEKLFTEALSSDKNRRDWGVKNKFLVRSVKDRSSPKVKMH